MFIATIVVTILSAVTLLISATGKLMKMPAIVTSLGAAGVPLNRFPHLAALEIAAGVGLIIGLFSLPLGIAAGIGAVLYFVGAIVAHLRVGDTKGVNGPVVPLLLAIAALVLRLLTS